MDNENWRKDKYSYRVGFIDEYQEVMHWHKNIVEVIALFNGATLEVLGKDTNSSYTLLRKWLLLHAAIEVNPW